MIKRLLIFSSITIACFAQLVPVSNYIGKHNFRCNYGAITSARINDKLYTFGGCYLIPYTVDPNNEGFHPNTISHQALPKNVSDEIQIYDIPNDTWSTETSAKTPYPWKEALTQTYNSSIYFYNIVKGTNEDRLLGGENSINRDIWKYNTTSKEWTKVHVPTSLPESLVSCQKDGKIYFTGVYDTTTKNAIEVFNAKTEDWEKPILLNSRPLKVAQMLCGDNYIHFLGVQKAGTNFHVDGTIFTRAYSLINTEYATGSSFSQGHNFYATMFDGVAVKDESFYALSVDLYDSTIYNIDATTGSRRILGTSPYTLQRPLILPYDNDEVFLFGGGSEGFDDFCAYAGEKHRSCNSIKSYNHKIIPAENSPCKSN